jgi:hypothetical protein
MNGVGLADLLIDYRPEGPSGLETSDHESGNYRAVSPSIRYGFLKNSAFVITMSRVRTIYQWIL